MKPKKIKVYRVLAGVRDQHLVLFERRDENMLEFMRQLMRERTVEFNYMRKDGTLRFARGTLVPEQLPTGGVLMSESVMNRRHETVLTYYDLDRQAWRAACAENLLGYYEET